MRTAEAALAMAGVGPGTRLLDVASGGGAVSLPAARLGADVLAVDFSQAMVELLGRKAGELGLGNLRVRRMDGMALDLEDGSFQVACSCLGVMLFPDRARGLSEMARVLEPGGKGVMIVLGPPRRVQPIWIFLEAMMETLPGFAPPPDSPLFCLQDLEVLAGEMEAAGFREVEATAFENHLEVESGEHLWETLVAGAPALTALVRSLPEDRRRALRSELVEMVRRRSGGSGPVSLPMTFNIGVGVRPE